MTSVFFSLFILIVKIPFGEIKWNKNKNNGVRMMPIHNFGPTVLKG